MPFYSRKVVRLQNFDYSSVNHYFITICTDEKKCIFGNVRQLNPFGEIAKKDIQELPSYYDGIWVEHFVVMPNHIHMILVIEKNLENVTVNQIISLYKAGVSRKIRKRNPDCKVWQRSFYEHVIRNQADHDNIWNYIENNPLKWELDRFYKQSGS